MEDWDHDGSTQLHIDFNVTGSSQAQLQTYKPKHQKTCACGCLGNAKIDHCAH